MAPPTALVALHVACAAHRGAALLLRGAVGAHVALLTTQEAVLVSVPRGVAPGRLRMLGEVLCSAVVERRWACTGSVHW